MKTIQAKNVPDELHGRIRQRASAEGLSISDYVLRTVRRDVDRPSVNEWLGSLDDLTPTKHDIDTPALLDEVRGERAGR